MAQVGTFITVNDTSIGSVMGVAKASIMNIIGVPVGTASIFDLSYLTATHDNVDRTTYTFSSQSLGTADSNRYIVVGVGFVSSTETQSISSVTVGGVSASSLTSFTEEDEGTWSSCAQIWIAAVPTGTTGDVVVTLNGTASVCAIGLWRLITDNITPVATNTDTADSITVNVNTQNGGGVVAIAQCRNGSTSTWTGVTEDFDFDTASGEYFTGGSHTASSTETPRTITGNNDGGPASMAGCAVSFAAT